MSLHFRVCKPDTERGEKDTNKGNRGKFIKCDTQGAYAGKSTGLYGGYVHGTENFGRSEYQNGTASNGTFYSSRTKDGKAEACKASEGATGELFDNIGEYFRISAQAEQLEAQNEASCLEGFAESFQSVPIEGQYLAALATENIRTYTCENGLEFVTDTKGFEPHRPYCNGRI